MTEPVKRQGSLAGTIKDTNPQEYQFLIGEYLSKAGQITPRQLTEAVDNVKKHGGFIGSYLLRSGYIEENTIPALLARQYSYANINIAEREVDAKVINLLPYEMAKKYFAFPVQLKNGVLTIAMTEPTNGYAVDEMKATVKVPVQAGVALEKDIIEAYRKYYKISDDEYKLLTGIQGKEEDEEAPTTVDDLGELISDAVEDFVIEEEEEDERDQFSASDAPIIKLVNQILVKAVTSGVSDVHIEPFDKQFFVRYRQDGALYKSMKLPLEIKGALIARFKIMSNLDITEKRVPQDGRIKMKLGRKREVDFRVSTLPTLFGESVVLRILDKSGLNVDLTKLGFTQLNLSQFMKAVYRPNGLILVTGPTGSGKTVTLYSSLTLRNTDDVKILTAEDPVEFNFAGINQVNIVKEVGMTFAKALKAFLRQDPDICMIGEIRDMETGEIAVEAAMTGHLVFSTLHTNDTPGTITRLVDMGIQPFNVAASLVLCTAQRLLRRVCSKCKQPVTKISANKLIEAGFDKDEIGSIKLYEGKGCPHCSGTGYKGRLGVFEVMELTPNIQEAVASSVTESQLRKIALKEGMNTLRGDGLLKAKQGSTTLDQVLEKTVLQKESLPPYLLNPDEMVFENGDTIIKEGNTDTNFFKLIQGCLEVVKGSDKIAEISEPNSYFGEMSALLGGRRTATIRSVGKSIVKVFPGDKLMETLEGYPEISKQVIHALVSRLEDTNKRFIEILSTKGELERTLKAVAPHAAQRISFGKQGAFGGGEYRAPVKPSIAPRPLKKPGDQTQTIRVVPQAPQAKDTKEATQTFTVTS